MVVVLNIDIIRALTGDYHDLVIDKDSVKCYGFKNYASLDKSFLDIGSIPKDKLVTSVIEDFLRSDIITWEPDASKDMKDIIKRCDGKTLSIERSLLSSVNNIYLRLINNKVMMSIINLLYEDKGYLEINMSKDKLVIIDKKSDNICFSTHHLDTLRLEFIFDMILSEVKNIEDIKIYQRIPEKPRVDINFLNTKVILTGENRYIDALILKASKVRDELKNAKHLQLKMEGF